MGHIMELDYKLICEELFGTSDLNELRAIAEQVNAENPRGAGRKPKFSKSEVEIMWQLKEQGMSLVQIAEEFHTCRQTVARCIGKLAS